MRLVLPSVEYRSSFLGALEEFRADHSFPYTDRWYDAVDLAWAQSHFDEFVNQVLGYARGIGLPEGFVPQTDYWLVDDGEFIGRVSIRHKLTPKLERLHGHIGYEIRPGRRGKGYGTAILKFVLPMAKELGLARVLLTCDETNEASRKIIEKNDGVLENKVPNPTSGVNKLRFWINL